MKTKKILISISLFAVIFFLFLNFRFLQDPNACPNLSEKLFSGNLSHTPEPPSVIWDLQMIMKSRILSGFGICDTFLHGDEIGGSRRIVRQEHHRPHIPPYRTTSDGRVNMGISGGIAPSFSLVMPERLEKSFLKSDDGSKLIGERFQKIDIYGSFPWRGINGERIKLSNEHTTICDGTPLQRNPSDLRRDNPYACTDSEGKVADCYDLTYVYNAKIPFADDPSIVDLANRRINIQRVNRLNPTSKPSELQQFNKVDNVWMPLEAEEDMQSILRDGKNYKMQFLSVDLKVVVSNPKTTEARIDQVSVVPRSLKESPLFDIFTVKEPVFTADGRFMILRIGGKNKLSWTPARGLYRDDANGVEYMNTYIALGANENPCEIGRWSKMQPLSYAHKDPDLNFSWCKSNDCDKRYGFARYPLRDAENNVITEGKEMGGNYPWVSKSGSMIAFTVLDSMLADSPYESTCVYPEILDEKGRDCNHRYESAQNNHGFAMAGLWTHGKTVLLDGLLNHIDYGIRAEERLHRYLYLYRNSSPGSSDWRSLGVAIGNGRMANGTDEKNYMTPLDSAGNVNFIDSLEHLFNDQPHFKPQALSDVVWQMNSGSVSTEVSFDDYLNVDTLIYSPMNASLKLKDEGERSYLRHQNGLDVGSDREIHLQNAATPSHYRWIIPPYGVVEGKGRIEPVALGGVHGRGFWLSPQSQISYKLDEVSGKNKELKNYGFYMGLFIDPRYANDGKMRTILSLSDGSTIRLQDRKFLDFAKNGISIAKIALPALTDPSKAEIPYGRWTHLGFSFNVYRRSVDIYVNGLGYKNVRLGQAFFNIGVGPLSEIKIGELDSSRGLGFRGWIDDFKLVVLKNMPNLSPELACNHARGSLLAFNADADADDAQFDRLKKASQNYEIHKSQINPLVPGKFKRQEFICFTKYDNENGAIRSDLEELEVNSNFKIRRIRDQILFPESFIGSPYGGAGLTFGQPRPDSTNNQFCLSCHAVENPRGLDLKALRLIPDRPVHLDNRRQPHQPPRVINGQLPTGQFVKFPDHWDLPGKNWND